MSEQLAPDTRNRSRERSKTPFHLRSQCDGENCNEVGHVHGPAKKSPTVTTIIEEPESPAVSHRSATSTVTVTRNLIYSESNNGASVNNNQNSIQASLSSTKLTVPATTTVTKIQTKSNQSSSSQRTALKAKRILGGGPEDRDNIVNSAHDGLHGLKHSTPKRNTLSTSKVSPKILENVNLNDHLAYKEYKEAGEYWKKYPKTDYVYSSTYSPFRREIKPGVIAMPNMSRRSLDHHQERIKENPTHESFIRSRYQSSYEKFQNFNTSDQSQDELDDADEFNYRSVYSHREKKPSIIWRFFSAIFAIIATAFNKTCGVAGVADYRNGRGSRAYEKKGVLSKTWSALTSPVLSIFRYIYVIIASIQFWDSCFLQSSNAESRGKKRFLLLLLLLLPLLSLAGLYHYHEKPLPIASISPSAFTDYIDNYVQFENVRDITYKQYGNLKHFSYDFLLYLQDLSENYAQEVKKVWTEKFST